MFELGARSSREGESQVGFMAPGAGGRREGGVCYVQLSSTRRGGGIGNGDCDDDDEGSSRRAKLCVYQPDVVGSLQYKKKAIVDMMRTGTGESTGRELLERPAAAPVRARVECWPSGDSR